MGCIRYGRQFYYRHTTSGLRDDELISVRFGQNIFVLGKVVKIALRLSVIRVLPTQDSAKR
jgi:hypothetical protein